MLIDFRKLFPKYGIKPKGVLHVGANVGEEAPVYLELGIKRQLWVEANPDIAAKLADNLTTLGNNENSVVMNFAASDENGETILHVSNNGSQSSSILELGTHKVVHPDVHYVSDVEVSMQRLDTALSPYESFIQEIDFLNMDIQGAELKALKGMGDLLNNFKWAYLEVNKAELYKGCALVEEIDTYLLGFGFKRVETFWCGNTGWGDALYIKGI
jgi:FkbM family methyltransferase